MKKKSTFLATFFIAACTAAIIVRYMQFVSGIIDFNTGFFFPHAGTIKHVYYITLFTAFIGFLVLAIIEKKRKTFFFRKKLGQFDDSDVALTGIMLMLAGFSIIFSAFRENISSLNAGGFAAVVLGTFAYSFAGGVLLFKKRAFPSVGVAMLGLSAYYVIRLVMLFLENYIILNMSEYLIKLLIVLSLALFYLSAGRMFLRAESKTTRIKACVFGFTAALLSVSETTAKVIFWFGAPAVTREHAAKFIMPDMVSVAETIALLILLICIARRKPERVKSDNDSDAEAGVK
ncbi:MAG: hypothetical protein FWG44_02755 [Oscillospiraceae bacterium]|nr:hypothetical protein [Oscillospiraceae bacterium]